MWTADAGGFHNESMIEEPSKLTNSVSVGGGEERGTRVTMPVSLSHVSKLTRVNEGLIIHAKKIMVVTTVVQVVEIVEANTSKLHMRVRDHTNGGCVDVHLIGIEAGPADETEMENIDQQQCEALSQNVPNFNPLTIRPSQYIRVFGQTKYIDDKVAIVAHRIFPVNNPNEITMHILEVIAENMRAERRNNNPDSNMARVPVAGGIRLGDQIGGNKSVGMDQNQLSKFDLTILSFIQARSREKSSTHIDELTKRFGGGEQLNSAIERLQSEGQIWNGDDDFSYVAAET